MTTTTTDFIRTNDHHRVSSLALDPLENRQQETWSAGDYGRIGVRLQIVGESLCEAVDLRSGERVLDVAAGNGNASLAAARRFALVTATDYVSALLDQARRRAEADGLEIALQVGNADALPFADGGFDVVLSTFGVMFTPHPERAAAELIRVVRTGGRIGLANWTPDGFIGQLFKVVGRFVPPPPDVRSPAEWGTAARLQELFGSRTSAIAAERRRYMFRYPSAEHWVDFFRTFYGPTHKAFAALDGAGQAALHDALIDLLRAWDTGGGRGLVIHGEYLEVVITK